MNVPSVLDRKGFTVLEVLIAAFLLLLVFFGLTQFHVRGRTHVDYEEDRRKATAVLQSHLDAIRRDRTFDTLAALVDTTYVVDRRRYVVRHDVTLDSPDPMAATIALTASWTARRLDGTTFQRQMTTTSILGRALALGGTP